MKMHCILGTVCGLALALAPAGKSLAQSGYVNFEGKQTNPVRLSPDGSRLFTVNTPDARVSVFDLANPAAPRLIAEIPVGIEPVSVNPRTNDEVWVVNEVSDSVSVVSVSEGIVTATLPVKDEPMDVVFAGDRAFVSAGLKNEVAVFDVNSLKELARIPLKGLNPRALAVSTDGRRVYAAFALSGNGTTIIPKEKAPAQPEPTNISTVPPKVALIVDAEDPAWADEIPYTMPDNDVAEIDTATLAVTRYFRKLGTVNLGLAVNPVTGNLWVANTDARNLTFFEPELRGSTHFNRVTRVEIESGQGTAYDLNPDIDYTIMPNAEAKAEALAQPAGIVFDPSGETFYVAAFGSDRVARLNPEGTVIERIEIGDVTGGDADPRHMRGPRGLALHPAGTHLYVLNRISNTISVIETAIATVTREFPTGSYDPTPPVVREGRGFLYDARLSGNGTMSCASCHIDAELDQLAWNLGDPGGELQRLRVTNNGVSSFMTNAHPMKGPMTTQTLRGLKGHEPLHWRGDRATFLDFNPAFDALLGGTPLANDDIQAFKDFVETIVFQPNPNRTLDNGLPSEVDGGDPTAGQQSFRSRSFWIPAVSQSLTCTSCHVGSTGIPVVHSVRIGFAPPMAIDHPTKIPHLRNLYQKVYFDNSPGAESLAGFGLEHDGATATFDQAHSGPRFVSIQNDTKRLRDLAAFLLCFDTGTHPGVGYSMTARAVELDSEAVRSNWDLLENQARSGRIDLIVRANIEGGTSYFYDRQTQKYKPNTSKSLSVTRAGMEAAITDGVSVSIMGVPPGSGTRMGIDRDGDGVLDGDEEPRLETGFAAWLSEHFNAGELDDPATSGALADPDGDQSSNLFEYGTGTSPRDHLSHRALQTAMVQRDGIDYPALILTRRREISDVIWQLEVSTDLIEWHYNGDPTGEVYSETEPPAPVSEELERVTIRGSRPVDLPGHYYRMRLVLEP